LNQISLLFFILTKFSLFAQINLENTYNDGYVYRVNLAYSGEKYYLLDAQNNQAKIYNADHTLWKSINLSVPNGALLFGIYHLSESKINSDSLVEVAYSFYINSGTLVYESRIINEQGNTLLSVPDAHAIYLNELQGFSNKIITHEMAPVIINRVYNINSLTLENIYNTGGYLERINLAHSGEKYTVFDAQSSQVKLYNSNHTLWKSINLTTLPNANIDNIHNISDNKINSDTLIEVAYTFHTYPGSTVYESRIINEQGSTLLTIPDATSIFVHELSNAQNKLIVAIEDTIGKNKVYSLPSLSLENTYLGGPINRFNLASSGEKYSLMDIVNQQAKIYNANHTLWKTINLPVSSGATLHFIHNVSENKINPDNLIEISYAFYTNSGGIVYESRVINELGVNILTLANSRSIIVDKLPGAQNKLIAEIGLFPSSSSKVYGFPSSTISIQKIESNEFLSIFPNPCINSLTIDKSNIKIHKVSLVSSDGKVLENIYLKKNQTTINLSDYPKGIYFVVGHDENNQVFCKKIIKG